MRISLKWLQQYIDVKTSTVELAETLTSLGLEVESIDELGKKYDGFVVGEVLDVQKHPKADRLSLCSVRVKPNEDSLKIVCGAPNVAAGQKVIVGLVGATVPHNQHDPNGKPFVLSKAVIRGVESSGMICSAKELGIGEDGSGIKVLESNAQVGQTVAEYLGLDDIAFEIGITPNRPDCLSHIGIARDIAAAYGIKYTVPVVTVNEDKSSTITDLASVSVENSVDCPRYSARIIRNVVVKDSPEWLKKYLTAAGLRPINNIVDVTNFVMLEYGQPLHAFDYDNLARHSIVVKSAAKGEKFTTLDGKTHELTGTELMICDGEKSVAIAGVMGGMNSEISSSTTNVLLESAYFFPPSVRKTAKRLGISTDASFRFERGIDPNITDAASFRAASLIAEVSGGTIVSGSIDVYPNVIVPKKITVRTARVNSILGTTISSVQVKKFLQSVEIQCNDLPNESFECIVPTFRPDIEQEIDLIEEVARLFGYDNIENKTSSEVMFTKPDAAEQQIVSIRRWCEANGLNEILTNSMIDASTAKLFSATPVVVKNPLSVELEIMRPSLLSTMLQSIGHNYNHGSSRLHFFEIGSVFSLSTDKKEATPVAGYLENNMLGICLSGEANMISWHEKQRATDLFDLKGLVLSLLRGVGIDNSDLIYYNAPSSLTEMTIDVEINNTYVGFIGKVKAEILKKYKIESDVFFAELDLEIITGFGTQKKYRGFSKFPTVKRDIAFIVKKDVSVGQIESLIKKSGGTLITNVVVFDLFEGKSLGEGMKSVAFSLSINSFEKTLTDTEIDSLIATVVRSVTQTFEATLRSI
ncbi:MAG: phenylalanine--tRNA ligase subunit beta [Bacteroidota bacterium]